MASKNEVAQALAESERPHIDPVAAALTAYEPSWRERIGNSVYDAANYFGMGNIANRLRNDVETGIDFVPFVGDAIGLDDARNDFNAGNYGMAAAGLGLSAAGIVPGVGDAVAVGGRKILKSISHADDLDIPKSVRGALASSNGDIDLAIAELRNRAENSKLAGARAMAASDADWIEKNKGSLGVTFGDTPSQRNVSSPAVSQADPFDYRMQHKAPTHESGAPLYALDDPNSGVYQPDIYSSKGLQYYGTGNPLEQEILDIANSVRGNPDAMMPIFRAVPQDIQGAAINPGDWVALNRKYAEDHGASHLGGVPYQILESQVPARELFTSGDSLFEWGWSPK